MLACCTNPGHRPRETAVSRRHSPLLAIDSSTALRELAAGRGGPGRTTRRACGRLRLGPFRVQGSSARHLRGLVGRAREAGLAVVMATQGLTDLRSVQPALVDQVLQDTAFQVAFRQGSPADAALMESLFGLHWTDDVSRRSDGLSTRRAVERPRVPADEWKNGLDKGDAWLRVAPIEGHWRQERIRVVLAHGRPIPPETSTRNISRYSTRNHVWESARGVSGDNVSDERAPSRDMPAEPRALPMPPRSLPPVPPECPSELVEKMGADVLAKVERRWSKRHHGARAARSQTVDGGQLPGCRRWRPGAAPAGHDRECDGLNAIQDLAIEVNIQRRDQAGRAARG